MEQGIVITLLIRQHAADVVFYWQQLPSPMISH